MKLAVSSAAFADAIARGRLTQLEWVDVCANELEVDGIVLDLEQFARTDVDYLAQLKKTAIDLGLTIAAVSGMAVLENDEIFAIATALGAPIVIARAPAATDDAGAWPAFAALVKDRSRAAKRANVVLAMRNAPGTLCATGADLRHITYDVDGSWLRFAIDPSQASDDDAGSLIAKCVIAIGAIADLDTFARSDDERSARLVRALARFRGFIVLETDAGEPGTSAYHAAIERFDEFRADALRKR